MEDPLAARFVESVSYDRRIYREDIQGSLAHAKMLKEVGLINAKDLKQIQQGLTAIREEIDQQQDSWPGWRVDLEDVHMCIEAALIEKTGDAGRKLHTGRSRNDQVVLDLTLWSLKTAESFVEQIESLCDDFAALAKLDGQVVMPSYTHLQRAQPIVAGGELVAWIAAFDRSAKRIEALFSLHRQSPLGSGAIAGSSLPLDRHWVAQELGLGKASFSSIDSTANRDIVVDFLYALSMVAMNLSRWAEQWVLYASTEFSFIQLDDRYTTGSSMMPQKRNPDMLELIRGRTGGVYGRLIAMLTTLKGLPIAYNRDLQEDKRLLFDACDCVADCLNMAKRIVSTTRFKPQAIAQGLERGFLDATSLAEYLVGHGVPFRTSHQMVGQLVRQCEQKNLTSLAKLTLEDFQAVCQSSGFPASTCQPDIYQWLTVPQVAKRYQTFGNAGEKGYQEALSQWQAGRRKLSS